jgi:hypothetical protein
MSNEELHVPEDRDALPPTAEEETLDPNGPPQPVQGPSWTRTAVTAAVCLAVGGTLFTMCCVTCTPCMGATRSAKLEWQKRQQEVQQAWDADQQQSRDNSTRQAAAEKSP